MKKIEQKHREYPAVVALNLMGDILAVRRTEDRAELAPYLINGGTVLPATLIVEVPDAQS